MIAFYILLIIFVVYVYFARSVVTLVFTPIRLPLATIEVFCKKHEISTGLVNHLKMSDSLEKFKAELAFFPKVISTSEGILLCRNICDVEQGSMFFVVKSVGGGLFLKHILLGYLQFEFNDKSTPITITELFKCELNTWLSKKPHVAGSYFNIDQL